MKRIVLTALDYGIAFGVDRAIRTLLADSRLTAVGCLAASDRWSREYLPLREQVEDKSSRTRIGLTLAFCRPFAPVSDPARAIFGERLPGPRYYTLRRPAGLLPAAAIKAEIAAQIQCFEDYYGRRPAFIAMYDQMDRNIALAKLVVEVLVERFGENLPDFLFSEPERLRSRLLARRIRKLGGQTNREAVTLPLTEEASQLHRFFWRALEGRRDSTTVWCAPAEPDKNLRSMTSDAEAHARQAQFHYLNSSDFLLALTEKDIFLF